MEIDMSALRMIEQEEGIELDTLVDAIEEALLRAYENTPDAVQPARVEIDRRTGKASVMATETDEEGNRLGEYDDTPSDFGRVAASTARQVIMQRLREVEDSKVLGSYMGRQGSVVTGIVQASRDQRNTQVLLSDGFEAMLPENEKVPGEEYKHGDRIRAYIVSVERGEKGPRIILSRSHPGLVQGLFKREVPEIHDGLVEIKAIAREAGHRTKIAVAATQPGVNAKGACIGPMGGRVRNVMAELGGEKIDIVDWSPDSAKFVGNALSPARVNRVVVHSEANKWATVVVPDFQLRLAIGRDGQNARLAARLTGFHIDIHSDTAEDGEPEVSRSSTPEPLEGVEVTEVVEEEPEE